MDRDASSSAADPNEGGTSKLLAKPKVMIFGASVAGLTAAHELAERGFSVEVVEKDFKRGYKGAPEVEVGGATRTRFFPANLDADPKRWASPPSADPAASPKAGGDDRGFGVPEHVEVSGTSYTLPFSIDLEVNDRDELGDGDRAKI